MAEPISARDRPHLRLVRGDASPEEVAAIVAVLSARAAAASGPPSRPARSAWADPRPLLRQPLAGGGSGDWRRSGYTPGLRTRADW